MKLTGLFIVLLSYLQVVHALTVSLLSLLLSSPTRNEIDSILRLPRAVVNTSETIHGLNCLLLSCYLGYENVQQKAQ